jgi:hypothetical protein
VSSPRATCVACSRRLSRMATSHTCMQEITVAEVTGRARSLLAATQEPSGAQGSDR